MPLPLALARTLLAIAAEILLAQRDRELAWAARERRNRPIPGRRLTGFDGLEHRLETLRRELRG